MIWFEDDYHRWVKLWKVWHMIGFPSLSMYGPLESKCIWKKTRILFSKPYFYRVFIISHLNTFAAGDYVKFNLPGAFATTLLTWGLLESWDGYERAGELDNMLDSIKWELDYFIKCHTKPNEVYAQVMYMMMISIYWWHSYVIVIFIETLCGEGADILYTLK